MTDEFQTLLNGLPPNWGAEDLSQPLHGIPHHYMIITENGQCSHMTVDKTFTLEAHLKAYWYRWGLQYGC